MDGQGRPSGIWKSMKRRLRFKMMACCGFTWNLRVSDLTIREEDVIQAHTEAQVHSSFMNQDDREPMIAIVGRGMNLATLLASERQSHKVGPRKHKKPLMRLFEEIDGPDSKSKTNKWSKEEGIDRLCCVCMERNKGAAFIPCGHTYCRLCSRELWLNRMPCPLCKHPINQILDIF